MKKIRKNMFDTIAGVNTYTTIDIGNRLRNLRKQNGYTIEQLSIKLEVRIEIIQTWEDGLSLPSDKYAKKLSELYNVSENYLFGLDK